MKDCCIAASNGDASGESGFCRMGLSDATHCPLFSLDHVSGCDSSNSSSTDIYSCEDPTPAISACYNCAPLYASVSAKLGPPDPAALHP
jgi:hypothetical protein